MSTPADITATELGESRKLFAGRRVARADRDLGNPDQVFQLVLEKLNANPRGLMHLSMDELRAIVDFAARAGVVASNAVSLADLSDADAAKPDLKQALARTVATARKLFPAQVTT